MLFKGGVIKRDRGNHSGKIRCFLKGENDSSFTIAQIRRMCEIVGKPFEETFKEREG